jgi:hypothetical protein
MRDHKIDEKLIEDAKKIFNSYRKDVVNTEKNEGTFNEYT